MKSKQGLGIVQLGITPAGVNKGDMMKKLSLLVYTFVLLGVGLIVAAETTLPHQFQSGELISASEMNENFTAVITGINSKQAQITGSCSEGSAIRSINPDGSVDCEVDDIGSAETTSGIDSLNGMTGSVVLQAGDNIELESSRGQITISATTPNSHEGDITSVIAGEGLTGGSETGDAKLAVSYSGTGKAVTAARSDHDHDSRYLTEAAIDSKLSEAISTIPGTEVVLTEQLKNREFVIQQTFPDLTETFTTNQAGRLLLNKFASVGFSCNDSIPLRIYFLTLNGEPVVSSAQLRTGVISNVNQELQETLSGVTTDVIPVGEHTIGVAGMCFSGEPINSIDFDIEVGASIIVLP